MQTIKRVRQVDRLDVESASSALVVFATGIGSWVLLAYLAVKFLQQFGATLP